jgi:hypothetical protein
MIIARLCSSHMLENEIKMFDFLRYIYLKIYFKNYDSADFGVFKAMSTMLQYEDKNNLLKV